MIIMFIINNISKSNTTFITIQKKKSVFRATLLLRTTCMRLCCNEVASGVATSETSLAFKRKMKQGMGAVSKLRAETVMSVVVTGTRGGCEKNSCGDGTTMFLEKVPVGDGPLKPNTASTEHQCKSQKEPAACLTNNKCCAKHLTVTDLVCQI